MAAAEGAELGHGGGPHLPPGCETGFGRALGRLTERLALLGGALMLAVTAITVLSVAGRYLIGQPVLGDYEITEIGCGIAVFLFFPYTQITGGNIVAEFFTARLSQRNQERLETVHVLIFAAVAAFLAWRMLLGGIDKLETNATTMLLGMPLWVGYMLGSAAIAILVVTCLWGAARLVAAKHP